VINGEDCGLIRAKRPRSGPPTVGVAVWVVFLPLFSGSKFAYLVKHIQLEEVEEARQQRRSAHLIKYRT